MLIDQVERRLECDVVVVGAGNAGLVAAIEAKNCGANVLIIEKAIKRLRGGNSRFSGGLLRIAIEEGGKDFLPLVEGSGLPAGELEIEPYTKDAFYNSVMVLSEGLADNTLTEIYVDRSLQTARWMHVQGVRFGLSPSQVFKKDGHLVCPAGITTLEAIGVGEGLVEMLFAIVEKRGITVLYETAACSLKVGASGKVGGLLARGPDGYVQIDAGSVILACGGHEASPEARRKYLGENWDLIKLRGSRYNTGDGIKMAVDIGAQTAGHWGGCHASIVSEDSPMIEAAGAGSERYSYPYSIMVNRDGERFVDEGIDFQKFTYARFGKEVLKQPGGVAFQIYDSKVFHLYRPEYQEAERVESESLEEMADLLAINKERFLKTVHDFNKAVTQEVPFAGYKRDGRRTIGLHPDKTNWAQKIDTPPYHAYAVVCGLTFSYGGLKTNEKTQVIDTAGRPIKGLYAVGEITGGFFYHNYPSGTGLTRGAVMGRIAGSEAASNR